MKPNHWITIAIWAVVGLTVVYRPELFGGASFSAVVLTIMLN